jgi:hypothetical protein
LSIFFLLVSKGKVTSKQNFTNISFLYSEAPFVQSSFTHCG